MTPQKTLKIKKIMKKGNTTINKGTNNAFGCDTCLLEDEIMKSSPSSGILILMCGGAVYP